MSGVHLGVSLATPEQVDQRHQGSRIDNQLLVCLILRYTCEGGSSLLLRASASHPKQLDEWLNTTCHHDLCLTLATI